LPFVVVFDLVDRSLGVVALFKAGLSTHRHDPALRIGVIVLVRGRRGRRRRRTGLVRRFAGALLLGPGKGARFDLGARLLQPDLAFMPARQLAFQAQPVLERLRIVGFGFGQQLLDLPFNRPQLLAGATVTDRTPMASAIG
jgi:hypothetical protein